MTIRRPPAAQAYRQAQIASASPVELVALLHEGAIRAADAACDAIDRRDIPARRLAIDQVLAILGELIGSLNHERGGPVARDLEALYVYMIERVSEAVTTHQSAPVAHVRQLLTTLASAWRELAAAPVGAPGRSS